MIDTKNMLLQQCLPLAVLKQRRIVDLCPNCLLEVATVLTACGIETFVKDLALVIGILCCNSAYRLRY